MCARVLRRVVFVLHASPLRIKSTVPSRRETMTLERPAMPLCLSLPPIVQCLLVVLCSALTPLPHQSPCSISNNRLHHLLIPHQARQRLCPRFSREVPPTVRIQPLIHHPLSRSRVLHLPQHMIRIFWVRTCCNASAVVQHVAATLPAGKEHPVLELGACLRVYRSSSSRS